MVLFDHVFGQELINKAAVSLCVTGVEVYFLQHHHMIFMIVMKCLNCISDVILMAVMSQYAGHLSLSVVGGLCCF